MKHLREFNDFEETEGNPKVKGTHMTMSEFEDKFGRIRSYTLGEDGEVVEVADLDYPHLKMTIKEFLDKHGEEAPEEED